jgi:hypothetical protein
MRVFSRLSLTTDQESEGKEVLVLTYPRLTLGIFKKFLILRERWKSAPS